MRYWRLPRVTLYFEPLEAVCSVPKVHAHLSAFSAPRLSYQALRSGSVTASSSSCATIDAIASAPILPFGEDVVCCEQELGHWVEGSPTNAYLMSVPPMFARV